MIVTDSHDIAACLNGEEEAYARLVKRHERTIMAQIWRFSRDPIECEELVQEVFVEAFFSLENFRGEAPFLYWLRRIATHVGYRFWKRQAQKKPQVSLDECDLAVPSTDTIDSARAGAILHSLLKRLDAEDRLVLTLMYFEDWSAREIAKCMGWNRDMVKMRAYRARKKLKSMAEAENLVEQLAWIR